MIGFLQQGGRFDREMQFEWVSAGGSATYTYAGDGLRASSSGASGTYGFAWDSLTASLPLLLSDGGNDYVYGPNDKVIEQSPAGTDDPTFLSQDRLGSTRLITDLSGSVVASTSYDPYGNVTARSGTATSAFGYDGEYTDPSGLIYLRARYYDPATGQFLTVDPLADLTRTPYGYAGGNPINNTDPGGLMLVADRGTEYSGVSGPVTVTMAGRAVHATDLKTFTIAEEKARKAYAKQAAGQPGACIGGYNIVNCDMGQAAAYIVYLQQICSQNGITCSTVPNPIVQLASTIPAGGMLPGLGGNSETDDLEADDGIVAEGDTGFLGDARPNFTDPAQSPGEGWEWRGNGSPGSSQGSWYNPSTGASLHPGLGHPDPIGPHYDYKAPDGKTYRIGPDGTVTPK